MRPAASRLRGRLAACAISLAAVGVSPTAAAAGRIVRVGKLEPPSGALISGLAGSGPTVAASTVSAPPASGAGPVYVFTEPSGGWSTNLAPSAELVDPGAQAASDPSVSGDAVVTNEHSAGEPSSYDDVFVEPSGGWSGTVAPAARLVAPGGVSLGPAVIAGDTVVAAPTTTPGTTEGGVAYVFVRPPGGWSGVVAPVAELADSNGGGSYSIFPPFAISGQTIYANAFPYSAAGGISSEEPVFGEAFRMPAHGWNGTVHESSSSPFFFGGVYAVGKYVASDLSIYPAKAPPPPFSSTPFHGATLYPRQSPRLSAIGAFDGALAVTSSPPDQEGSEEGAECPCARREFVFSRPADGWWGTLSSGAIVRTTTQTDEPSTALFGRTLIATDRSVAQIYSIIGSQSHRVAAPKVIHALASGLTSGHPKLAFEVSTTWDAPRVYDITLFLPRGLTTFTSPGVSRRLRRELYHHVTVRGGGRYWLFPWKDQLDIALPHGTRHVSVTVPYPALRESRALVRASKRAGDHGVLRLRMLGRTVAFKIS